MANKQHEERIHQLASRRMEIARKRVLVALCELHGSIPATIPLIASDAGLSPFVAEKLLDEFLAAGFVVSVESSPREFALSMKAQAHLKEGRTWHQGGRLNRRRREIKLGVVA